MQRAGADGAPEPRERSSAADRSRVVAASSLVRVRVRVNAKGRVQGVWFRDSCREAARAEALHGFVRNCADGSVEAEFEGPEAAVERMIEWCRIGPPRARVDTVDVERIATVGEPGFRIK